MQICAVKLTFPWFLWSKTPSGPHRRSLQRSPISQASK